MCCVIKKQLGNKKGKKGEEKEKKKRASSKRSSAPDVRGPFPVPCAPGSPFCRTGGLRTNGLVDKLVRTMAAVTLSMSSSSEDFLEDRKGHG